MNKWFCPIFRYYGRKMLYQMMGHEDFDKMVSRYVPANCLRSVQDTVENLRKKGLGEMPSDTPSARYRRSGQGSRTNSSSTRGSSATRSVKNIQNQIHAFIAPLDLHFKQMINLCCLKIVIFM